MRQENSTKRYRRQRTRNQRKREKARAVFMMVFLMVLWMLLCTVMVKAWAGSPAEQHVNGYTYMEAIGGEYHGNLQD